MPKESQVFYTRKHEKGATNGASFLLNVALAFFAIGTAVITRLFVAAAVLPVWELVT